MKKTKGEETAMEGGKVGVSGEQKRVCKSTSMAGEGASHLAIWGQNIPDRDISKYKGPEAKT